MNDRMLALLFQFGWKLYPTLAETLKRITPEQVELLKSLYAAFHGLSSKNAVTDHLALPRMCSLPDTMPLGTSVCRWPSLDITYDIVAWPTVFTKQDVVAAIATAFGRWAAICGIRPKYSPGIPNPMILIGTRSIDGPYGVLAESELPCGNVSQCRQWYDTGEPWGIFDGPSNNSGLLDYIRVATHELGHALGMSHIGAGNLLAPVYSANIWTPQAGDIAEMQARYGKPAPTPIPPSPIPNPSDPTIIRIYGGNFTVDGYRLTKLEEAA